MSVQSQQIPPVPSPQEVVGTNGLLNQAWQQWFLNLRDKLNVINDNLVNWANSKPVTGVTPGTYGDATDYPIITLNALGQVTSASQQAVNTSGGILPIVTGEIVGSQPVFVYLDDGSLVYGQVQ